MSYEFNYADARPNETKLVDYLEEVCADWKEVALTLLQWLSDDDVGDFARAEGYYFEDYDE